MVILKIFKKHLFLVRFSGKTRKPEVLEVNGLSSEKLTHSATKHNFHSQMLISRCKMEGCVTDDGHL